MEYFWLEFYARVPNISAFCWLFEISKSVDNYIGFKHFAVFSPKTNQAGMELQLEHCFTFLKFGSSFHDCLGLVLATRVRMWAKSTNPNMSYDRFWGKSTEMVEMLIFRVLSDRIVFRSTNYVQYVISPADICTSNVRNLN